MDAAAIALFATNLLGVAKHLASKGYDSYTLAIRATDLFDKALEMQSKPNAIWTVWLQTYGEKKIHVIKAVREYTNLSLKDAKELVEAAPCPIAGDGSFGSRKKNVRRPVGGS